MVSPTFTQRSSCATTYGFADKLDIDRYTVNGTTQDYVVGVRELEPSNLTGNQTNWINQHTFYTHGYGFVAAAAEQRRHQQQAADFTEGDIPPIGPLGLTSRRRCTTANC